MTSSPILWKSRRRSAVSARQPRILKLNRKPQESACAPSRRAGELLKESAKVGTRQKRGGDRRSKSEDPILKSPALSELNISLDQSSNWQKLAYIPTKEFNEIISDPAEVPTTLGVSDRWNRQAGKVEPKPKPKSCRSCQGLGPVSQSLTGVPLRSAAPRNDAVIRLHMRAFIAAAPPGARGLRT